MRKLILFGGAIAVLFGGNFKSPIDIPSTSQFGISQNLANSLDQSGSNPGGFPPKIGDPSKPISGGIFPCDPSTIVTPPYPLPVTPYPLPVTPYPSPYPDGVPPIVKSPFGPKTIDNPEVVNPPVIVSPTGENYSIPVNVYNDYTKKVNQYVKDKDEYENYIENNLQVTADNLLEAIKLIVAKDDKNIIDKKAHIKIYMARELAEIEKLIGKGNKSTILQLVVYRSEYLKLNLKLKK